MQFVLPYERSGSLLPNASGMYQVALEMYPPETKAQLKFVVGEAIPPTNTRLQCTSVFYGGEVRFEAQLSRAFLGVLRRDR